MISADLTRPGVWQRLFPSALALMADLEAKVPGATWSFGGGTVLMLRMAHRHSKDIDLFVPDPQYLGYVNPRLSDAAADISSEYEEAAEYVKLYLPDGEIDVVAGGTLTREPVEIVLYQGRQIRVETSGEIIAKKMWHRGNRAKGRDLFDLCAVAEAEPEQIAHALPFMRRHGEEFLQAIVERSAIIERELDAIDAIGRRWSYEECLACAERIIRPVLASG